MTNKSKVPDPETDIKFIDVHCHMPYPKKKNTVPSASKQYTQYFEDGGLYLISCSIDWEGLQLTLEFMENHTENYGFTCGWAPQTVTYTPKSQYVEESKKWLDFVRNNPDKFLAIGEIGLDFHHAKTLKKRKRQISELKRIFRETIDLGKPYIIHVRNPSSRDLDKRNPKHRFNKEDGATKTILEIMEEFDLDPNRVMFHCFSGPEEYGRSLPEKGFTLSVPSSAYGFKRWRENTRHTPLTSLVTETDSYYQHPYKRGPYNIPSNVKYSVAAIAYTHNMSQKRVAERTVRNAINFFDLPISSENLKFD
ncbi:MAG: TatD family hydrolase [Promethearchaeia archaeon]